MKTPFWINKVLKFFFPYRFQLARLTCIPLLGNLIEWLFFNHDRAFYLPKDNLIKINRQIQAPEQLLLPSQILDHFIERASYRFIMDFCICREGDNCQDYPHDIGCIFLGDAVLKINPKFGRLATIEETKAHAALAREKGLVHLIGRNHIDSRWLNAYPSHKLLTICNCCPCCCLWKMLPDLNCNIQEAFTALPGVSVSINEQCVQCGKCFENVCFVDAIKLIDGKPVITDACLGCGRCVEICPTGAIDLQVTNSTFLEETIQTISDIVDYR